MNVRHRMRAVVSPQRLVAAPAAALVLAWLLPAKAYAHGGAADLGFLAFLLAGPYLVFLASIAASLFLGRSREPSSGAKAAFWMQAAMALTLGSLCIAAASQAGWAALFYLPGLLTTLLVAVLKAPRSQRRFAIWLLPALAILPGLLVRWTQ